MGIRGMVVGEDYSNQNSSYRQGTSMPQPQTAPPIRAPHMIQAHQARPSYGGYNPQGDYTAYYAGPSGLDYSYSYDTYRSNSDASIYGSPVPASATPPTANVYPGMAPSAMHPVHTDLRQGPGVFYDFSGSTRPPPSQYYYSTQPVMYAAPHSPMQSTAIGQMPPASLSDKKRELQVRPFIALQKGLTELSWLVCHPTAATTKPPAVCIGTSFDTIAARAAVWHAL